MSGRETVAESLPLLGEPLPIELANTWYCGDDSPIDFLELPAAVGAWCEAVVPHGRFDSLELPDVVQLWRLRELRDAVRAMIEHGIDGSMPPAATIDLVNTHAAAAPPITSLGWDEAGRRQRVSPGSASMEAVMGLLAAATIDLVAGASGEALARCAAGDCSMLFVRNHGRRRFCHDSCSHRERQARYDRRQRAKRC